MPAGEHNHGLTEGFGLCALVCEVSSWAGRNGSTMKRFPTKNETIMERFCESIESFMRRFSIFSICAICAMKSDYGCAFLPSTASYFPSGETWSLMWLAKPDKNKKRSRLDDKNPWGSPARVVKAVVFSGW